MRKAMYHRNLLASLALCALLAPAAALGGELKARIAPLEKDAGPAVVWLEGLSGKVPARDTVISHRPGGEFDPPVTIGFVGNEFVLRNDDDTLHNIWQAGTVRTRSVDVRGDTPTEVVIETPAP